MEAYEAWETSRCASADFIIIPLGGGIARPAPASEPIFPGCMLTLPGHYHCRYFNSIQSECFTELFSTDINMIITAPTGGGKTVAMELAMLRLLSRNIHHGQFRLNPGAVKAIYLAPAKALVQEKVREWKERFGNTLGLTVKEVSGMR